MMRSFLLHRSPTALAACIMLLGLAGPALTGCDGQPPDRNQDLLQLFAGELDNGSLVDACKELSSLCEEDNMGCAAFELFCGSTNEEEICAQLEQTCMEQGIGCEVYEQQCKDPGLPPDVDPCCELAMRCRDELVHRHCEGGQCQPTGEIECKGDPDTGVKCYEGDRPAGCDPDENGQCQGCEDNGSGECGDETDPNQCGGGPGSCGDQREDCEINENGERHCPDPSCGMPGEGENFGWLPESCEVLVQECADRLPMPEFLHNYDVDWAVEQVCKGPEEPEHPEPMEQCCEAAARCLEFSQDRHCESGQDPNTGCFGQDVCKHAMEVCSQIFPVDQLPTEDLYQLFEEHCVDNEPPEPPEGQCCDMARQCIEVSQWFGNEQDPDQEKVEEICFEAFEVCSNVYPDIQGYLNEPGMLVDLFHQVCEEEKPEEKPQPTNEECCELAQICASGAHECMNGGEQCEEWGACEELVQKCNLEFDPDNPQEMFDKACY